MARAILLFLAKRLGLARVLKFETRPATTTQPLNVLYLLLSSRSFPPQLQPGSSSPTTLFLSGWQTRFAGLADQICCSSSAAFRVITLDSWSHIDSIATPLDMVVLLFKAQLPESSLQTSFAETPSSFDSWKHVASQCDLSCLKILRLLLAILRLLTFRVPSRKNIFSPLIFIMAYGVPPHSHNGGLEQ
jgi:hypothetical protein